MKQKILSIAIVLAAIALLATASATTMEIQCQPSTPTISVLQGAGTAIISGANFRPCHTVTVFLDDMQLPCVGGDTNYQGAFTAIIVIPNDTPLGSHMITVADNFGNTATTPLTVISLQGPKGETGATGAQGEIGATGPIGPEGPKGDTGASGQTGAAGTPFNATGDIFLFNGTAGATGAKGDKGDTGAQGSTGATGPRGFTGAAGEDIQGRPGVQGDTGPAGSQGPKGDAGQNVNSDYQGLTMATLLGALAAMIAFCAVVVIVFRKK